MAKPKVFFRCDANSSIGMGHLIRSSALADMISKHFEITFLTLNTPEDLLIKYVNKEYKSEKLNSEAEVTKKVSPNEILVLDGYDFDSEYQKNIKKSGIKIVYIDDLKSFEYSADVIINQAEDVKQEEYRTVTRPIFCLGPQYALLRREFLNAAATPKVGNPSIESAFVCFGGADADNITHKSLKVLSKFKELKSTHVLTGPVNKNIENWKNEFKGNTKINFHSNLNSQEVCSLMQSCQIALCPSSSLALEVCAAGMVLLTGITADNQKGYYEALIKHSAALGVWDWQKVSEEDLYNKLIGMMRYDKRDIEFFILNQKAYIDGKSGQRLENVFLELSK